MQNNDNRHGNVACPFCDENLRTLIDLHDHLILCGTKTDQCPKCQRFIQRAVFAYHYENDCAQINPTDIDNSTNDIFSHGILPKKFNENSSELLKCEFCQEYISRKDYPMHRVLIEYFCFIIYRFIHLGLLCF